MTNVERHATLRLMTADDRRKQLIAAGYWLRSQRERRGFARPADLARALKVDRSLVSNWENGKNAVTDERAEQIAKVLAMDLVDVRRGLGLWVPPKDDQTSEPPSSEDVTTVDEEELYQRLLRLPPLQLQTVYEVVRAMTPDFDDEGEEIHHRE